MGFVEHPLPTFLKVPILFEHHVYFYSFLKYFDHADSGLYIIWGGVAAGAEIVQRVLQ